MSGMWFPKRPQNLEEAKLTGYFVQDQILKIAHDYPSLPIYVTEN